MCALIFVLLMKHRAKCRVSSLFFALLLREFRQKFTDKMCDIPDIFIDTFGQKVVFLKGY